MKYLSSYLGLLILVDTYYFTESQILYDFYMEISKFLNFAKLSWNLLWNRIITS